MTPKQVREILEACLEIKAAVVSIGDVLEKVVEEELDKFPDAGDDDDDKDEDEPIDLEDAIREHTAAIAELLKKKAGKSEVSFSITAK